MNKPANITIRRAILADIPRLVEIETATFAEKDRFSYDQFRWYVHKSPSTHTWAVINDNKIVGYFVLKPGYLCMRIFSIAIVEPHVGIGSQVLAWIDDYVIHQGKHKTIMVEVREDNPIALLFYEKNGYKAFAKEYKFYGDGTDAMKMKKELVE